MSWLEGEPILNFKKAKKEIRNKIAKNMFYIWYKHKMAAKEYWKEQKRKKDWRDDNDDSDHME